MEVDDSDERSSLLQHGINWSCKKFFCTDPERKYLDMIVEIGDRFFFTKTMYAAFILNLTIRGISGAKV